jgi:hypothetical protein
MKCDWQTLQASKLQEMSEKSHSFGQALFANEKYLFVGADDTPMNGTHNEGCVYVYDKNSLSEVKILYNPKTLANSFYGWSIAQCGNDICIGVDDDDSIVESLGSVDVFDKNLDFKFKLSPPIHMVKSYFGFSMAAHGDELIVGAPAYRSGHYGDIPNEAKRGMIYIYQNYKMKGVITRDEHSFGWSIDLCDQYYFSSSPEGAIYLFDKNRNLLDIYDKLPSVKKIKFHNDRLFVSTNVEGIYVFSFKDDTFFLELKIASTGGYSFDVNNNYLVVSDVEHDEFKYMNLVGENLNHGKIFVYDKSFNLINTLSGHDVHNMGHCLLLDRDVLYCGVPGHQENKGIVLRTWIR